MERTSTVSKWVIARSVFYIYGVDWVFLQDWEDWTIIVGIN